MHLVTISNLGLVCITCLGVNSRPPQREKMTVVYRTKPWEGDAQPTVGERPAIGSVRLVILKERLAQVDASRLEGQEERLPVSHMELDLNLAHTSLPIVCPAIPRRDSLAHNRTTRSDTHRQSYRVGWTLDANGVGMTTSFWHASEPSHATSTLS